MEWWAVLLISLGTLVAGAVIGFFLAKRFFKKHLEKNPPINEAAIREMFRQMGRTASEKQIRNVMASMNQANQGKK